ncbi:hypothetical protein JI752_017850 [Lysobacter sp. MMG2]|uniref:hypothetical protein n=1 Tax=Lysobacter sp. MMG2 TaxID=2801338 RepID=UPI001C24793F|nr:hypothetical protein [Lysobacter sp. MMG2]MBU8978016.1 hypothetical protein [Lysobacter sp. MMG2]
MFWLMGGGMMLASGEPPLGILLILVGITLPVVTANRAMDNARARQGKARDFTTTWEDVAHLSTCDVVVHVVSLVIGIALAVVAVTLLGVGGA